ncbi:MAG: CoA transferase [Chloroflexi bacterium]|nr:CoA transferase [Chloroflexota bacterium]
MVRRSNSRPNTKGPLHGVNVIDMGTAGVGPYAAALLGHLGANVIRVEAPFPDMLFYQLPTQRGVSTAYTFSNLSKRNIVLDLRDKANWPLFQRLLKEADVVMENQRPDRLALLGATYEAMLEQNPRIIYVSCPGWGMEGVMRDWFCAAGQAEAFCGFGSLNGPLGNRQEMTRYPYMDPNASAYITSTVLLALYARERTGQPQRVTLSQIAAGMAVQISRIGEYFVTGRAPLPLGSASASTAPHQAFFCQDKMYIAVGVESQAQWLRLCRAIGQEGLAEDPRFATNPRRVDNREALQTVLEKVFLSKPGHWWCVLLSRHQVPVSQFSDHLENPDHPQTLANDFFAEMDIPKQGHVIFGALPWKFSHTPPSVKPPALPDDHHQEISTSGFGAPSRASRLKPEEHLQPGEPPLRGIKVLELTQGLCGPYVSLLLADSGASVTKVEPPEDDFARSFAPQHQSGVGAAFLVLNRNKKLVRLNLASPEGRAALNELVCDADVLLLDWTPTVEQELGLDPHTLEKLNPSLVCCAISPFGEQGPLSALPGSELVVQAAAGAPNFTGRIGEHPVRFGADVANLSTAVFTYQAILAALFHRLSSGQGQRISTSQLGSLNILLSYSHTNLFDPDDWVGGYCDATITPPNWGYRTKDGHVIINLGREATEQQLHAFCGDMGMQEVLDTDPRFQNLAKAPGGLRRAMRFDTRDVWERHTQSKTTQEIVDIAVKNGFTAPAYNNLEQLFKHPQAQLQNMVKTLDTPSWGTLRFLYPPWHGPWKEPEPTLPNLHQ